MSLTERKKRELTALADAMGDSFAALVKYNQERHAVKTHSAKRQVRKKNVTQGTSSPIQVKRMYPESIGRNH